MIKHTSYAALKATFGDWEYYLVRMSFVDASRYLHFAEEIRPNPDLDELIQRDLTSRASGISDFLMNNEERFFGSLIVAVYGGKPKFSPIELENQNLLGEATRGIGLLSFDGEETYYVLDGQHRLAAMRDAEDKDPNRFKSDEISIVLISHTDDNDGIQRARRLFTNLNRYAKKTDKSSNIALDEDDPVAILTRRLLREDQYFASVIKVTRNTKGKKVLVTGEALSSGSDKVYLMTLATLYDCNKALLQRQVFIQQSQPQVRPAEEALNQGFAILEKRWKLILESLEELKADEPERFFERSKDASSLYWSVRPIGLKALCNAVGRALDDEIDTETISKALNHKKHLTDFPWKNLIWDADATKILIDQARMKLMGDILYFWMNSTSSNATDLESRLADLSLRQGRLPEPPN